MILTEMILKEMILKEMILKEMILKEMVNLRNFMKSTEVTSPVLEESTVTTFWKHFMRELV